MRLSNLGCTAVLLAALTGSAYASTITMRGGGGSEPFTTLNFSVDLDATGANCLLPDGTPNPGCIFQNETDVVVTEIDFLFNVPQPPSGEFGCGIAVGSPFSKCTVVETPSAMDPMQVTFEFFDGSLAVGGEFGLSFPVPFPANTDLAATANPTSTPEPGSALLLLTCLTGILIVWRGRRRAAGSKA